MKKSPSIDTMTSDSARAGISLSQATSVRGYLTAGLVTTFLLFGGLVAWAAVTDLAGAVLASGSIVVAGNVKKIQHPTGGVIGEILVKNGDRVKAGDVLVRLDETVTRANLQLITRQIDELTGRQTRLRAERDEQDAIEFPADLMARRNEPAVEQILTGEDTLFRSRLSARESQRLQLDERIAGLREEIAGTTSQAAAKAREIDLISQELAGLQALEAKQLVTTSKLMALRREGARLDGERAQLQAAAGQTRGRIAEIEVQKISLESEAKSDIVKELRETEGTLVELAERRTAADDQLRRIDIKSPAEGLVHQMSVFTVGGVIASSEPLMLIVPEHQKLIVEARIAPQNIDQARSHSAAFVRFPAFNQRTTPVLEGHISNIAADLTREPQTGVTYYIAQVELNDGESDKLKGLKLVPGMPAELQIKTDPRTALSYLVKPIEDQFAKAFKER